MAQRGPHGALVTAGSPAANGGFMESQFPTSASLKRGLSQGGEGKIGCGNAEGAPLGGLSSQII